MSLKLIFSGNEPMVKGRPSSPGLPNHQWKPTAQSTVINDSDSDDNENDTRMMNVLTDVQIFLKDLNTEHLTDGAKNKKHSLSHRIDFVTRRSKSKSQ